MYWKSQEERLAAMQLDGINLIYVEQSYKTIEICSEALKTNGYALKYVPQDLITRELCEIAIKSNKHAICFVPGKYEDIHRFWRIIYE